MSLHLYMHVEHTQTPVRTHTHTHTHTQVYPSAEEALASEEALGWPSAALLAEVSILHPDKASRNELTLVPGGEG